MGKGRALSDGVIKKIILSYTYVAIWIFLSFTVIVYNKYILDKKMYNWPFPITLTMIHMGFCSSLAVILIKVFKVVEPVSMSRETYLRSVVPIGALYSLSLWLSNSAYIYLSVSFIQMLKALMPVAVYSIGVLLKKETFKSQTMTNMLSISFGVAIAAYGEAKFDGWGVFLQLGAVAFEATRLVLIQILLTSKGINLNPITSLYYVAPCCLVFLSVPWIFVEFPVLRDTSSFHFDFVIFGTNSVCAFALNLAVFLLVGKTSALTMNVAGVVKDWLLIAFSWSVIKDTVTPINLFGYGLAFLGVGYYNHCKLQALKAKDAQKKVQASDEEAGKLLEEREAEAKRSETQD
ncbi:PREDICTED: probable sugar phosphate/phosphate translocator At2g25520 [Camelina sativa]|uniref:Probable sugar phosphate/phosphate translocator At2g25520 n=1 Tax=Camelina sativa TaxID=90675 RepID=A0ABM0TQ08_CAMSA|nr:PREDICTED: probable sugar phosphate/phosphate translocator At2g25520 [Camelina sativa]XP_010429544.1 PREDICTED: probable sugar phosphate/phosphate translocator At2g25520 [Camelina sativa]XP_010472552.1 PREDICTED: probable sugar phosphate/phosphate translocator At2g25520 [Camelina sativa]